MADCMDWLELRHTARGKEGRRAVARTGAPHNAQRAVAPHNAQRRSYPKHNERPGLPVQPKPNRGQRVRRGEMLGGSAVEVEVGDGAPPAPPAFTCSSPTRNEALLLLSASACAAKPDEGTPLRLPGGCMEVETGSEQGVDPGAEAVPIACATIDTVPQAPPTAEEQAETILRQQQEIHALRELCATQASAIEQLRHAASMCLSAAAPGTSPPPPYGPASPSTDELHLDADSPTNKFPTTKEGSATFNASSSSAPSTAPFSSSSSSSSTGTIPPSLEPLHSYHSAAAAAAAQAAAAYAAYTAAHGGGSFSSAYGGAGGVSLLSNPRAGGITPAGDCARPASAASAATAPNSARKQPRTPASQLRHADHHVAGRAAAMPAAGDEYAAASILHPHSRPPSSFEAGGGGGYHQPAYQHKRHRAGEASSAAPSAAPSPAHHRERADLPWAAVTLSLPPFRTTVSKPAGGRAAGSRTNTHVLWTPEEDACLRALVEEHGEQAWALVASRMPHERNNKQCRERWRNHLRPACNKGPWTEEEDALILERVQQHGTKWAKISGLYLPDRPENDIKNRWHILIRMQNQSANSNGGGGGASLPRPCPLV